MTPPKESVIRDFLAERLDILESGLTLIDKEFYITVPGLPRGFIDILAKDQYGMYVAIELKVRDQAARDGAHEIFKYITLFQSKYGYGPESLRFIVASSEWHELKMSLNHLKSVLAHHITGYKLELSDDGSAVVRATVFQAPIMPSAQSLHAGYPYAYFRTAAELQIFAKNSLSAFRKFWPRASFGILELESNAPYQGYAHAAVVFAAFSREDLASSDDDAFHGLEVELEEMPVFECLGTVFAEDTEEAGSHTPDSLAAFVSTGNWSAKNVLHASGMFEDERLYNKDSVLAELLALDGKNFTFFHMASSWETSSRWAAMLEKLLNWMRDYGIPTNPLQHLLSVTEEHGEITGAAVYAFAPHSILPYVSLAPEDMIFENLPNISILFRHRQASTGWSHSVILGQLHHVALAPPQMPSMRVIAESLMFGDDASLLSTLGLSWRFDGFALVNGEIMAVADPPDEDKSIKPFEVALKPFRHRCSPICDQIRQAISQVIYQPRTTRA